MPSSAEDPVKPRLRGWIHATGAVLAIPAVWTSYSLRGVQGKKQFDSLKVYKLLNGKYSYILYISLFITTMIMITG